VCVDLAATNGFRITNPELQEAIEAKRRQEMERLSPERSVSPPAPPLRAELAPPPRPDRAPPVPPPARFPVRDAAEAYQRHLDDISGKLRGRDVDASRVDGLIAVRLRVTGFDRAQVTRTIRTEAPRLRPGEERDWDAYATRTAAHAFGAAGERQARLLQGAREPLLAIEGRARSPEPSHDIPRRRGRDLGR
jgi:hypothetical protein